MPLVKVTLLEGRSRAEKEAISGAYARTPDDVVGVIASGGNVDLTLQAAR